MFVLSAKALRACDVDALLCLNGECMLFVGDILRIFFGERLAGVRSMFSAPTVVWSIATQDAPGPRGIT